MLFPHLSLPSTQIGTPAEQSTGDLSSGYSFTYNTGTLPARSVPWSNLSIKATDAASLPVLYTAAYLAALKQNDNQNQVLLPTTPAWGTKGSLIRQRVVTFPTVVESASVSGWINDNTSWLMANHISVVQLQGAIIMPLALVGYPDGTYEDGLYALECGLPVTGVAVVNEGAAGDVAVATVDPSSFVGGTCFEIRRWLIDYTTAGEVDVGTPLHFNQAAADVATNIAIYPRFAARKVVSFGDWGNTQGENTIRQLYQNLLGQLAAVGFDQTLTNTQFGSHAAYFASLTPQIKAFFGVP
jgi:hypothetical protein